MPSSAGRMVVVEVAEEVPLDGRGVSSLDNVVARVKDIARIILGASGDTHKWITVP